MNDPAPDITPPKKRRVRRPSASITVGGFGGAGIAPLLVWIASQYGLTMPPEVAASAGAVLGALLGFVANIVKDFRT